VEISVIIQTFKPFSLVLDFKTAEEVYDFRHLLDCAAHQASANMDMIGELKDNVNPYIK
jgi:hypothetical protein